VRAIATAREVHWGGRQLDRRVRTDDTDLRLLDFPVRNIDGLLHRIHSCFKPLLGVFASRILIDLPPETTLAMKIKLRTQ
jgi:hypothetical protein